MTKLIKDVFTVHNLVTSRSLSGEEVLDPIWFVAKFGWTESHALDVIHVFRAIQPDALKVSFKVECPSCKEHTTVDEFVQQLNTLGSYEVKCDECWIDFKVTVDKLKPYFRINPLYVKSKEDYV